MSRARAVAAPGREPPLVTSPPPFPWSLRIGTIAGIGVYVHATFLLLLGFVALTQWRVGESLGAALAATASLLALFAMIVLHELGHALAARHYGIRTRDITLLPIGGLARLERIPSDPVQELVVALAGPMVNLVLGLTLFVALLIGVGFAPLTQLTMTGGLLLARLMWINLGLAVFNLLPAFPMDGGRVLRALLALRMEYRRATQIAAGVGQAMGFAFAFLGLFGNPMLLLIAVFVWMGAAQEAGLAELRHTLEGLPISRAMITNFETLAPDDTLARAADHVLAGFQHDFPVVERGHVVGVLTRSDLLTALARRGEGSLVDGAMQRQFETAEPLELLEHAFARLQHGGCYTMPVLRDDQLVGMLTLENVGEFLMIQSALERAHQDGDGYALHAN